MSGLNNSMIVDIINFYSNKYGFIEELMNYSGS